MSKNILIMNNRAHPRELFGTTLDRAGFGVRGREGTRFLLPANPYKLCGPPHAPVSPVEFIEEAFLLMYGKSAFRESHRLGNGLGLIPRDRACRTADHPTKVFKRLFSTKKSPGFGLWEARKFMRNNGGDLTMDSRLGQGAMFVLRLPVAVEGMAL